ncbi:hypothetical protein HID58_078013, partial [Brassica napus]
TYLPPLFSDHAPCVLDLAFNLPTAGKKPFKFQNYLIKHPGFTKLLKDAWILAGNECQTLVQLCWKLKLIKRDLKLLNKENYSKIQERINETNGLLQLTQYLDRITINRLSFALTLIGLQISQASLSLNIYSN